MTKISFDVDFNQDPEKILQEIQKRAEAEVAKREAKDKEANYLSRLHEVVNKEIGSDYKNINALIRALTKYASPSVREKIFNTSPAGRRKTISMNKEIYDEIQTLLSRPNPNKAAIARETGVSVVQVRKVAEGGYDKKFGGIVTVGKVPPIPKPEPLLEELPPPSLPPAEAVSTILEESNLTSLPSEEEQQNDLPFSPLSPDKEFSDAQELEVEATSTDLPPLPSFEEDVPAPLQEEENVLPPPPAPLQEISEPSLGLPPAPSFGEEEPLSKLPPPPAPFEDSAVEPVNLPPPPSFGDTSESSNESGDSTDEFAELPPPPPPLDAHSPTPTDIPPPPSFGESEEIPSPPSPIEAPTFEEVPPAPPPPAPALEDELPAPSAPLGEDLPPAPPIPESEAAPLPPSPSDAPGLTSASNPPKPSLSGKPSLSLNKGKSKTKALKLTRPPLKKKLPPLS